MLIACWISKATNTNSEYVILIALYTAAVVTRTHFSVTVYVHCHFYLLVELKKKKTENEVTWPKHVADRRF